MTFVQTYINGRKYTDAQIRQLIKNEKEALLTGLSLNAAACSVAVRKIDEANMSGNAADKIISIIYTAAGKGAEVKGRFVKAFTEGVVSALQLADSKQVVCVIKEQQNDNTGLDGVLLANNVAAVSAYEG